MGRLRGTLPNPPNHLISLVAQVTATMERLRLQLHKDCEALLAEKDAREDAGRPRWERQRRRSESDQGRRHGAAPKPAPSSGSRRRPRAASSEPPRRRPRGGGGLHLPPI